MIIYYYNNTVLTINCKLNYKLFYNLSYSLTNWDPANPEWVFLCKKNLFFFLGSRGHIKEKHTITFLKSINKIENQDQEMASQRYIHLGPGQVLKRSNHIFLTSKVTSNECIEGNG